MGAAPCSSNPGAAARIDRDERAYPRRFFLKKSTVRCQASTAAALS
jgi:hypothetical protein